MCCKYTCPIIFIYQLPCMRIELTIIVEIFLSFNCFTYLFIIYQYGLLYCELHYFLNICQYRTIYLVFGVNWKCYTTILGVMCLSHLSNYSDQCQWTVSLWWSVCRTWFTTEMSTHGQDSVMTHLWDVFVTPVHTLYSPVIVTSLTLHSNTWL